MRLATLVRRGLLGAATATLVATGVPEIASGDAGSTQCRAYSVIGVRGTDDGTRESIGDRLPVAVAALSGVVGAANVATDHVAYSASVVYPVSMAWGRHRLRAAIDDRLTACPDTRLVLFGFSQGAHVVGDVVAAMPQAQRARLHGVGLIGDPMFNPRLTGSVSADSPRLGGMWGRRGAWPADVFVADVCNTGDPVCGSRGLLDSLGHLDSLAHQDYVTAAYSPVHGMSSAYAIGLKVATRTH